MPKLGLQIVAGLTLAAIAFACASEPPPDFVPPENSPDRNGSTIPAGDGGGSSSGASSSGASSGTTGDSGKPVPSADCSKMTTKVDDRPACDTCAKQKCCTQIQACEASAACKAAQQCVAACASDDFFCVLQCSATGGSGAETLQAVGTCASQQCPNECPSSFDFDGGSPF